MDTLLVPVSLAPFIHKLNFCAPSRASASLFVNFYALPIIMAPDRRRITCRSFSKDIGNKILVEVVWGSLLTRERAVVGISNGSKDTDSLELFLNKNISRVGSL